MPTAQLKRYVFERVFRRARISEADVMKGKYVIVIIALFGRQRALILGIGQIQKREERGKILIVLPELPQLRRAAR